MKNRWVSSIIVLCCATLIVAEAPQREKRVYTTAKLQQKAPIIDGLLTDSVWQQSAGWGGDFVELTPDEGTVPPYQTRFKIVYDDDNIYAAILCYDDPAKVRRVFAPRDQKAGDLCGIAFDSYLNHTTAYEFDLTAAGQKVDLMYLPGLYNYDHNWNPIWQTATALHDSGWVAEFKIPFSQLRYTAKNEQVWGFHAWRVIDRDNRISQWNIIPSSAPPGAHNFGLMKGMTGIHSSRQMEFLPYTSLKFDYNRQNFNPFVKDWKFSPNAGIDAKIGISSNFTLDATINPDFGQVEADPSRLNLSAYETYYDEKRPFFLEGTDIFDFKIGDDRPFYTRRIGAIPQFYPMTNDNEYDQHPDNTKIIGSGKLTGRTQKGVSIGILETVTNPEYDLIYSRDTLSTDPNDTVNTRKVLCEPLTNYFASRFKKESSDANTMIGGTINSVVRRLRGSQMEDEMASTANSGGIDFQQSFRDKNYLFSAKAIGSYLTGSPEAITAKQLSHLHRYQRTDAEHLELDTTRIDLSGAGGYLGLQKTGGKFVFSAKGSFRTPALDLNDEGYMAAADIIDEKAWVGTMNWEQIGILRAYQAFTGVNNSWTFGKERTHSDLFLELWLRFTNRYEAYFFGEHYFPALDVRVLRGGPALYQDHLTKLYLDLKSDPAKRLCAETESRLDFNAVNNSSTKMFILRFVMNPVDKLRLTAEGMYERRNLAYEYIPSTQPFDLIGRLNQKTANITLRAEYFIKPEISFQYYGSPYFAAVHYSDFRRVNESRAKNVAERFRRYAPDEISFDAVNNSYHATDNSKEFDFGNPDQSFSEFRSNFVFRWEYRPGSQFYLVWTHNQGDFQMSNDPLLRETGSNLFKSKSRDIFMAKISYWFGI
jgi:hypothetical protein